MGGSFSINLVGVYNGNLGQSNGKKDVSKSNAQ